MFGKLFKLIGLVELLILPFVVTSPYYLHLFVTISIFSIVALGLDVVFGYTGEVSLGHAALFGKGSVKAGSFDLLAVECAEIFEVGD